MDNDNYVINLFISIKNCSHAQTNVDRTGKCFPNVMAALDDLHIEIKLTEELPNHRCYFCWKQFYSVHLQTVATCDMCF